MRNTITCLEDIETAIHVLCSSFADARKSLDAGKVLSARLELNERICDLYRFAEGARDKFSDFSAHSRFCEDIEIVCDVIRQHQLRWPAQQIMRNPRNYIASSRHLEHVVKLWIADMKRQLGPVLLLCEICEKPAPLRARNFPQHPQGEVTVFEQGIDRTGRSQRAFAV